MSYQTPPKAQQFRIKDSDNSDQFYSPFSMSPIRFEYPKIRAPRLEIEESNDILVLKVLTAFDPNDDFLKPSLKVVLNGQTKHMFDGKVIIHENTRIDSGTPEFIEYVDKYDPYQIIDPDDIRIARWGWDNNKNQIPKIHFPKGNSSNYELLSYLGDGTYSDVHTAIQLSTLDGVVVKTIKSTYKKYAERELCALLRLKNTHKDSIVQVIDAYINDTSPVIVFEELFEAKTFDYLTYYNQLDIPKIKLYFKKLFYALYVSHSKGVMHLDIKPANIIYNGEDIQIIDWGVADFYFPLKQYRTRVGTRHYRAPEQLIHYKYYDYSVDVWAMGCILADALFQKHPFFNGKNNDDQLVQIVKVLGSEEFWLFCQKYNITIDSVLDRKLQGYPKMEIKNDTLPSDAIDLLNKIFVYDHRERLTAQDVLEHPFFI